MIYGTDYTFSKPEGNIIFTDSDFISKAPRYRTARHVLTMDFIALEFDSVGKNNQVWFTVKGGHMAGLKVPATNLCDFVF